MSASEEGQKSSLTALTFWGGVSTVLGLASDLLSPLGPFAMYLLAGFTALAVVLFIVSLLGMKGARNWAKYSAVGAIVFGIVVALQYTTRDEAAPDKGFLASSVPAIAEVQEAVLPKAGPEVVQPTDAPTPPPQPVVEPPPLSADALALETALATDNPAERITAARAALASADAAVRAAAIERLYASGDAALRQQVVIAIFAARAGGASFPIVVVESPDNDPRQVANTTGKALTIRRVNAETGAVEGAAYATTFSGTVGRSGINLRIGVRGSMVLTPEDNFVLRGTVSSSTNGAAQVEVLLQ